MAHLKKRQLSVKALTHTAPTALHHHRHPCHPRHYYSQHSQRPPPQSPPQSSHPLRPHPLRPHPLRPHPFFNSHAKSLRERTRRSRASRGCSNGVSVLVWYWFSWGFPIFSLKRFSQCLRQMRTTLPDQLLISFYQLKEYDLGNTDQTYLS